MKHLFITITILATALTFTLDTYANEGVQLPRRKPSVSANEYLYEIKDNQVLVNDQLITLFAFTPKGISASYRNKTEEGKKPQYALKVYNSYGMLVGTKKLGESLVMISFGSSTYMEPGAVSSERIYLTEYPLTTILEHTNLVLPDDLLEMKWVVISDTNTKPSVDKTKANASSDNTSGASSDGM